MAPEGRAETPEQKRKVMEQILAYWLAHPDLRLGQLIENARLVGAKSQVIDLFYIEDEALVKLIGEFNQKYGG